MTLDIEGVLADWFVRLPEDTVGGQYQRMRLAEVAAVLREQIAAAQAEAYDLAADAVPTPEQRVTIRAANPYRAAQVAASRVPGEES